MNQLLSKNLLPHPNALTANGKSMGENCKNKETINKDVIKPIEAPMLKNAGFINMKGNLFDSAIMKTSVISEEFRQRYLSNPKDPNAFEGRAIVFTGPEEFHETIDDPSLNIDENCVLIMRGAGPIGYPGGAEVVNMRPPSYLLEQGVHSLPCIGDGRQSGTSGSPSILNASPEAADGGGLALLENNDMVRVDLNKCTVDVLIDDAELKIRKERLDDSFLKPESQTPWQDIFREKVNPFSQGMTLKGADKHRNIAERHLPRDNH